MLSQLKARRATTAPTETEQEEDSALAKNTEGPSDAEQARLTCDALCSLANGIRSAPSTSAPPASPGVTPPLSITSSLPGPGLGLHGFLYQSSSPAPAPPTPTSTTSSVASKTTTARGTTRSSATATSTPKTSTKLKSCPKQHQLPLFLSKTYHMIDRCDPDIATWSATGDNYVVKNVEKFASSFLPLYFKHSNFSSFARQLNF